MVPPELLPFLTSGLSTLVGTAGSDGRPHCMRGIGIGLHDGARRGRVYLPCATAVRALANLEAKPRVAVALSKPQTHRTVQLKGAVLGIGATPEAERAEIERLFLSYVDDLAYIGLPRAVVSRMNRWPCWSLDFELSEVFVQTPGPRAGNPLTELDI